MNQESPSRRLEETQSEELSRQLEDLQQQALRNKQLLERLTEQVADLEFQLQVSEQNLRSIRESRIWRILRWVEKLLSKFSRRDRQYSRSARAPSAEDRAPENS